MHKPLSHAEVEALNAASPVTIMTKAEKLERWAVLLEKSRNPVYMAHNLEHMTQANRDASHWGYSPMMVAAADPVFRDAGLKGDTVKDVKEFFEITDEDVHAFSCDCGGSRTGEQMASRVRDIANGPSTLAMVARSIFG